MKVSDLNPHIRYAGVHHSRFQTNFRENIVSVCYDCRVFYFDHASGSITVNGAKYDIINKTAIYLPPESEYRFDVTFTEDTGVIVLDFDLINQFADYGQSLGTATRMDFDPSKVPRYPLPEELSRPIVQIIPHMDRMLMQCADNFVKKIPLYKEQSSALLKLCLLEFIRRRGESKQSKLCEEVLAYIYKHYADTTLTNDDIARQFSYHPYHLSRIIKEETGMTLHRYLMYYRLQIAKDLLLTTQYDISEIAWRSGFCTDAYFIKIFRENTGTTPRQYRSRQTHTEL